MELTFKCYLAKHAIIYETGMTDERETVSIIFEFNTGDLIVQSIAYDFFNPRTAVEIPATLHQELEKFEGLSGNYIGNINDVVPSLRIISDNELRLSTKNMAINVEINKTNLRKYGFKSLKELALLDSSFQVLFTTKKIPNGKHRNIYQSFIFPPKIEKPMGGENIND